MVQCVSCLGAQLGFQASFWLLVVVSILTGACALLQRAWKARPHRMAVDLSLGALALLAAQATSFIILTRVH